FVLNHTKHPHLASQQAKTTRAPARLERSRSRHHNRESESVLWNGRIHFVGPREDPALEIENLPEARFAKEIHGLRGSLSTAAMRHDFPRRIQLVHAPRQLAKRNEVPLEIADLVFVRLAHIQD